MRDRVWAALDRLHDSSPVTQVIAGGARGADSLGAAWAEARGFECEVVAADWDRFGRSAGFRRNLLMLDMCPDMVVAFVDKPLANSRGTAHTVGTAESRGIPTRVFRSS
jgi:hypothetical protein